LDTKKETKKELRKYLSLVAYCHEEHLAFDHEIGKDPDCLSCENFKKLTAYVKIFEKKWPLIATKRRLKLLKGK